MKFLSNKGKMCIMHDDQKETKECYVASLKMTLYVPPRKVRRSKVAMADPDPQTEWNFREP